MRNSKALADAKRRIADAEAALLSLDRTHTPYDPALRARLIAELKNALEDYYALVSGEPRKPAATSPPA